MIAVLLLGINDVPKSRTDEIGTSADVSPLSSSKLINSSLS